MENVFDVLIAGAGPAGSEFAFRMARHGYRVLVLEQGPLEREKPCGGGIQAQEIIEFGPLPEEVVERHIELVKIVAPDGGVLEIPKYLEACGATVKRSVYDQWLVQRAQDAGAIYREYTRVRSADLSHRNATIYAETIEGQVIFKGRLFAVAIGGNSTHLMRAIGVEDFSLPEFGIATQYWLSFDPSAIDTRIGNTIEMYCGTSVVPQGYAWIFPKRDVVVVGVGCNASQGKNGKVPLKAYLDAFIQYHPIASEKLLGGKLVRKDGGPIPFCITSRLSAPSTIVLGDAGGFGSAIHGGGIYQARKSAAIAEPYAQHYLENGSPAYLDSYATEARTYFDEYEARWDLKMRPFFWEDDLVNVTVRNASSGDESITRAMGIIVNSDASHREAYQLLEPRMLDMIHDCLSDKTASQRNLINQSIKGLFQKETVLDQAARHILFSKAKRIRSALALIATQAAGGDAAQALPMAVGFELLHTASLIHDDIMDDAQLRRGRQCVHRIFGTDIAITAGDALIFAAYRELLSLSSLLESSRVDEVLRIFSTCALRTCRGQTDDLTFSNHNRSIIDYLRMVRRKTGSMIEAPMEGGAIIANASLQWRTRFREFGRALGMAFQIVDDAIDYLGTEDKVYKTIGNDLRRKKGSAMMIYCRERCNRIEQATMSNAIKQFRISGDIEDAKPVLELFDKYDAIGFTQRLCERYINRARQLIKGIGKEPARTTLDEIASIVGYWGLLATARPSPPSVNKTQDEMVTHA